MIDKLEEIIYNTFYPILDKNYKVKSYLIHKLGIVYMFKLEKNYLVSISYEYADEFYSLYLDNDVRKYDDNIYFLEKHVSNTRKFQRMKDAFVRKRLGLFYTFRKDFLTIAKANIEFFFDYIYKDLQLY